MSTYRLYRRSVREFLNRGNSKTRVESILTLLVESGALYCIYWVRRLQLPVLLLRFEARLVDVQVLTMLSDFGVTGDFGFGWPQPNISVREPVHDSSHVSSTEPCYCNSYREFTQHLSFSWLSSNVPLRIASSRYLRHQRKGLN